MHPVAPCACLESRFPSVMRAEDGLLGWKNVLQPLTISGLRVSASRDAVGLRYKAGKLCCAVRRAGRGRPSSANPNSSDARYCPHHHRSRVLQLTMYLSMAHEQPPWVIVLNSARDTPNPSWRGGVTTVSHVCRTRAIGDPRGRPTCTRRRVDRATRPYLAKSPRANLFFRGGRANEVQKNKSRGFPVFRPAGRRDPAKRTRAQRARRKFCLAFLKSWP